MGDQEENETVQHKIFLSAPRNKDKEEGGGLGEETTDEVDMSKINGHGRGDNNDTSQELTEYFSKFGTVLEVIQLFVNR